MTPGSSNSNKAIEAATDPRVQRLRVLLGALERRFRLEAAVRLLPWAIAAAFAVIAVLALTMRLSNWLGLTDLVLIGIGIVLALCAGVFAYAFFRPRAMLTTALQADMRLGLDERLSTALEDVSSAATRQGTSVSVLRSAQLDDALHSLEAVDPARDLPIVLNRRMFAPSGLLVLLLLGIIFFPAFAGRTPQPTTPAQVAAEQQNIEVLKQAIENSPNAQDPALQKLLQELAALSHDLKEGDLTSEQALARLSDTEAQLQKALDPQAPAQREALDQLSKQLSQSQNESLKQAGDALAQNDPKTAAQDLAKAVENADKMTPEERKALAQDLRAARDKVASLDPELASRLSDAADALESGDTQAAKDAMKNLADNVQQTASDLATQKQLEHALSQIQQSKENIAGNNQATPSANSTAVAGVTAGANGTSVANGTTLAGNGTAVASNGTSVASGSPISGTAVAVSGTIQPAGTVGTGTPVLAQGTPGQGTPVVAQGQGQSGQGQGQNGQGQGQGQGQNGQGQGQGQGQNGQGQGQGVGPPASGWGKGHEEPVYVPPSSVQSALTPVTVQGQDNPDGEQSTVPTNSDNNTVGQALTPYEDVYGQYQDQAGDALNSDYIPQGYKDLVRDYFDQIAPK